MRQLLTLGLAFGLLCGGQSLTIRLYNSAGVPKRTLNRAAAVTGRLFAGAGVTTIWQPGAPNSLEGRLTVMLASPIQSAPDDRGYVAVRIEKGMPPDPQGTGLGYALPHARQGAHATVYYDKVEKLFLSAQAMPGIENLLGAAMAHEIGHVLLGSEEHSAQGIMKARWGRAEFQLLACNRLQFTLEEIAGIRAGVYRRAEAVCVAGEFFFSSASINGFKNCN
jgi:hypothetical protein